MSHTANDLRQYLPIIRPSIITLGDGTPLHSSLSPPLAKASAGYSPPHRPGGGTVLGDAWSDRPRMFFSSGGGSWDAWSDRPRMFFLFIRRRRISVKTVGAPTPVPLEESDSSLKKSWSASANVSFAHTGCPAAEPLDSNKSYTTRAPMPDHLQRQGKRV